MTDNFLVSAVTWDALYDRFTRYRTTFDTTKPNEVHYEVVEFVLELCPTVKLNEGETQWLSQELALLFKDLLENIYLPPERPEPLDLVATDGMLTIDHNLAQFAQGTGKAGRKYARFIRKTSRELFDYELYPEEIATRIVGEQWDHWETKKRATHFWPVCFLYIAQSYFLDVLQNDLEEKRANRRRQEKSPPGLQGEISRTISKAFFEPKNEAQRGLVRPCVVVNKAKHVVAYSAPDLPVPGEFDAQMLRTLQHTQQRLDLLRNVTAHRLIRYIAQECAKRYQSGKSFGESRLLSWEGGMQQLAELIGEPNPQSGKAQHKLKRILEAGRCLQIEWPNGTRIGGLWMERQYPARGWRGAWGELDVAPFFVPGFAHRYRLSHRQIVPIVPLPPGIQKANSKHQGALAACQLELITLMTERKSQIVQYGGTLITTEERARIANLYGLKQKVFEDYFELWLRDTDHGVRMLEEGAPNRYLLADNEPFGAARLFLLEGGRRSRAGQERQKRASKTSDEGRKSKARRPPRGEKET